MLHAPDLALVERDRRLSSLTTLLDDQAMLALLQKQGYPVQRVTSTYLRYKPHTNCLVAYTLQSQASEQASYCYAKAHLPGSKKLTKYRHLGQRYANSELLPVVLEELGLAIAPLPFDRQLKSLTRLFNPATQLQLCCQLLALDERTLEGAAIALTTLNYKPERRYVCRVQLGDQNWVFKVYAGDNYDTAQRNSKHLQSGTVLQMSPQVGCSDRDQILAFPWVDDQPLEPMLQADPCTVQHTLRQVGVALAELHRQHLHHWQSVSCVMEASGIKALMSDLAYLQPSLTDNIEILGQAIVDGLMQLPQQWRSTHGDFKPDQVLFKGDRLTLLDFDRAAQGHPARDLGSFLAQLDYQHLRGSLDDHRRHAAATGFLEGYVAHGEVVDPKALRVYRALSLFKLLPEPFRHRAPDWPKKMQKLLDQIDAVLQRSDLDDGLDLREA